MREGWWGEEKAEVFPLVRLGVMTPRTQVMTPPAAIGDAASTPTDAATSSAERRRQDAAASSTSVVVQADGSHRFTGYAGAGTVAEFNAAGGIYTASVDGMYYALAHPFEV